MISRLLSSGYAYYFTFYPLLFDNKPVNLWFFNFYGGFVIAWKFATI